MADEAADDAQAQEPIQFAFEWQPPPPLDTGVS